VIELGITVALIGVMAAIVLIARGMIVTARHSSAIELIRSVREGAKQWSAERCNGLGYECMPGGPGTPNRKVNWGEMRFPNEGPPSPWDKVAATINTVNVGPQCAGVFPACIRIEISVPDDVRCEDLVGNIAPDGQSAWAGIVRANCTEKDGWLTIVSR
jgi:hypothetical protein